MSRLFWSCKWGWILAIWRNLHGGSPIRVQILGVTRAAPEARRHLEFWFCGPASLDLGAVRGVTRIGRVFDALQGVPIARVREIAQGFRVFTVAYPVKFDQGDSRLEMLVAKFLVYPLRWVSPVESNKGKDGDQTREA